MGRPAKNEIGNRYIRLVVVERVECEPWRVKKESFWLCRCDCGNELVVKGCKLREGTIKSCGCYAKEKTRERSTTHGDSNTVEYGAWASMWKRCTSKTHRSYKDYGGRGIKVCERWLDYANFLLDMGRRPGPEYSLDRVDNDGDYCLENCRWTTRTIQARNRRSSIKVTIDGKPFSLPEVAEKYGINLHKLRYRLKDGIPIEQIIGQGVSAVTCDGYNDLR